MRHCACRQPVSKFSSIDLLFGHVCSCVLGLSLNALDPAPVSDCGLATTPFPHCGSLWVRVCNLPPLPCPPAFNDHLPHRHALTPVKIRAPSPLQYFSVYDGLLPNDTFSLLELRRRTEGPPFPAIHASSHGLCV